MFLLFAIGCKQPVKVVPQNKNVEAVFVKTPCPDPIIRKDTIVLKIDNRKKIDSLTLIIKKKNDSLFIERYRLERVKYYNGIAQRNSTQLKFLIGWINRAVK